MYRRGLGETHKDYFVQRLENIQLCSLDMPQNDELEDSFNMIVDPNAPSWSTVSVIDRRQSTIRQA